MILDYTNYIEYYGSYGKNSPESNKELFFSKRAYCPFCKIDIKSIYNKSIIDTTTLPKLDWHKSEEVWECTQCGWWEYSWYSYMNGEQSWDMKDWSLSIKSGILKKFKIDSNAIPINSLRTYIQNNNSKIFNIHHKKMEELVGSVFQNHYNCEVQVVGKSSDGGVDLILVRSDKPIIVQVKRRTVKSKTESVKEIRDLLGATLLADCRDSIFVTTADHFSPDAIKAKTDAITKNIVNSFELFDYKSFMDMLDLYKKNEIKTWNNMIQLT